MRHSHTRSHCWVFIKQSDRPDHLDLGPYSRSKLRTSVPLRRTSQPPASLYRSDPRQPFSRSSESILPNSLTCLRLPCQRLLALGSWCGFRYGGGSLPRPRFTVTRRPGNAPSILAQQSSSQHNAPTTVTPQAGTKTLLPGRAPCSPHYLSVPCRRWGIRTPFPFWAHSTSAH